MTQRGTESEHVLFISEGRICVGLCIFYFSCYVCTIQPFQGFLGLGDQLGGREVQEYLSFPVDEYPGMAERPHQSFYAHGLIICDLTQGKPQGRRAWQSLR